MHLAVEAVQTLGAVEREASDAVANFEEDVLIAH
jgi:hypothetical protein